MKASLFHLRLEHRDGRYEDLEEHARNIDAARDRAQRLLATRHVFVAIDWRGSVGFVDSQPAEERLPRTFRESMPKGPRRWAGPSALFGL